MLFNVLGIGDFLTLLTVQWFTPLNFPARFSVGDTFSGFLFTYLGKLPFPKRVLVKRKGFAH